MKIPFASLVALTTLIFTAQADEVIAPGAKLQKLSGHLKFAEGPTCDAHGNLFFSDQPNNRLMEWSAAGKLSTFMQPAGRINGMMFDARGNLIACAEEKNQLWSIAPDKTVSILITNFQSRRLYGPNDVWVAPNGGLYITDAFYRRGWADPTVQHVSSEQVFYLSPDRKNLRWVTDDLKKPNGITGTPDGKNLYVSDIRAEQTWRYDILPDGLLTNKTLFCDKGSDGMTIDAEGNLYLTARGLTNGVSIFNSVGKMIGHIDVPEIWSANVCFGGADHKTLFITASEGLYSIRMNVRGANVAK
ncbi:MAG TPA: SMP-30/gluconolactonase/LRE family protein [Verrucomicrobiae bacterium]|nr:SMP-30/gluconolactonase/LRE family protein [Verrucomicrobiae bacterium]